MYAYVRRWQPQWYTIPPIRKKAHKTTHWEVKSSQLLELMTPHQLVTEAIPLEIPQESPLKIQVCYNCLCSCKIRTNCVQVLL